jgi:hypothetical protein
LKNCHEYIQILIIIGMVATLFTAIIALYKAFKTTPKEILAVDAELSKKYNELANDAFKRAQAAEAKAKAEQERQASDQRARQTFARQLAASRSKVKREYGMAQGQQLSPRALKSWEQSNRRSIEEALGTNRDTFAEQLSSLEKQTTAEKMRKTTTNDHHPLLP